MVEKTGKKEETQTAPCQYCGKQHDPEAACFAKIWQGNIQKIEQDKTVRVGC